MGPEPRLGSTLEDTTSDGDSTLHDHALPASDPQWRDILEGTAGGFGSGRRFLRHIPSSPRC